MSTTVRRRALALAALPLVVLLSACGGGDGAPGGTGAATQPCGTLPTADPSATIPAGLPALDGSVLYAPSTQGKTQVVFALVHDGDFVGVRDELAEKIRAAGWTIEGTDQEAVEAEAQFSKSPPLVEGSIKVDPYCEGYVSVRYRVSS